MLRFTVSVPEAEGKDAGALETALRRAVYDQGFGVVSVKPGVVLEDAVPLLFELGSITANELHAQGPRYQRDHVESVLGYFFELRRLIMGDDVPPARA